MIRQLRFTAALLAVVMLLGLAGCNQAKDANAAIDAANAKAASYTALDTTIATLMDKAAAADLTPDGVAPGIEALTEAAAKYEERARIIGEVKAEFEKIAAYDVSEEIKTYAKQQVEIADLLHQTDVLGAKQIADTKALYELIAAKNTDTAKADELSNAMDATAKQLEELNAKIVEKQAASDKYFIDQGLGK